MSWQQGQLKAFNDCAQRLRKLKNSRWNAIKWEHGEIYLENTRITVENHARITPFKKGMASRSKPPAAPRK